MDLWNSAVNRLQKFRQLAPADRRILISSFFMLPLVTILVRTTGLRRSQKILYQLVPHKSLPNANDNSSLKRAYRTAWLVDVAAREGLGTSHCLQKSLVLWWQLLRLGIEGEIYFGVRKDMGNLKAHAWVEFHSIVLNDNDDVRQHYSTFDSAINTLKRL